MALIVKLNPTDKQELGIFEYYDSLSGLTLLQSTPQSSDLSGFTAAQLVNVYQAVKEGRLILVSGTFPAGAQGANQTYATSEVSVASGSSSGILCNYSGELYSVLITYSGSAGFTLTDGLNGTVLFTAAANAAIGPYDFAPAPFVTNLYANTGANTPSFVVGVSQTT